MTHSKKLSSKNTRILTDLRDEAEFLMARRDTWWNRLAEDIVSDGQLVSNWESELGYSIEECFERGIQSFDSNARDFFQAVLDMLENKKNSYLKIDRCLEQLGVDDDRFCDARKALNKVWAKVESGEIENKDALKKESKGGGEMPQDTPERALDYEKIISIIFNAGKDMERRLKTYAKKKEEELRDHLLTALNGQFKGKATAETFSSEGKTDIYLPIDGEKAFIAECKIWRGEKYLRKAIEQLLRQAIRSDTQTALIVFNHNKNTSRVEAKIKKEVNCHPNYKRFDENTESETKLCYTLHHPKDRALELTITVLVFDLPNTTKGIGVRSLNPGSELHMKLNSVIFQMKL